MKYFPDHLMVLREEKQTKRQERRLLFVSLKIRFVWVSIVISEKYHKKLPFERKFSKKTFFRKERLPLRD
jgi:hypothetical protein